MDVPSLSNAQATPFAQRRSLEDVIGREALALDVQRRAQLAETARLTRELTARLTRAQIDMMRYQTDRGIENLDIKRTTSTLASRLGLLSKVLQNLG